MKEAVVLQEIRQSILTMPKTFYCKIPDQARFTGEKSRFAPPRPFDCFVVYRGRPFAFEVKIHKGTNAFPVRKVSSLQVGKLMDVAEAGGEAGILICIQFDKPLTGERHSRVLLYYPVSWWIGMVEGVTKYEHRKSIRIIDLLEEGYKVKWQGKGLWKILELLDFFVDRILLKKSA